jgi:hypothetical protein
MAYVSRSGAVMVRGSAHEVYLARGEVYFGVGPDGQPLIDDQTTVEEIAPIMRAELARMADIAGGAALTEQERRAAMLHIHPEREAAIREAAVKGGGPWDVAARAWLSAVERQQPRSLRFNGEWWDMTNANARRLPPLRESGA